MIQGLLLLIVGLFLIYVEFFLPGGVMGTAGALIIISSIAIFAQGSSSLALTMLFVIGACVGVGLVIKIALWRIRSKEDEDTIYLHDDQEGYHASKYDETCVGMEGKTHTRMSPSGHVVVAGTRHQAVSQTGYIEKGKPVKVIGGRGAYLIVKAEQPKE